jgi:GNAT superfamily N-acetyltransferase
MELEFIIENNPEVMARLSKTVHDKHQTAHPDIFAPYKKDRFFLWYQDKLANPHSIGVLARHNGQYIGFALVIHRTAGITHPFLRRDFEMLYVDQMSIEPAYQNRGIGKQMLQFIVDLAKKKNISRVQLDVWNDNAQALKSYTDFGFQPVRQVMEVRVD